MSKPITSELIKEDIEILKQVKQDIIEKLYVAALHGKKYIYLGDFYIPRSLEEIRKIIIDYSLAKVEMDKDRDILKDKVYTKIDIWRRAREIEQYLLDGVLNFFEDGYIFIPLETKYDEHILIERGFGIDKCEDNTIKVFLKKEEDKDE